MEAPGHGLLVVFIFTLITCQEFHSLFSVQFLLRRLCTEDSDFSLKSEEMCDFFDKHHYSTSVVQAGLLRVQQIDPRISPSQPRSEIHHSKIL